MNDDRIIVEKVLMGDINRFEFLVKKYQQPVYNVILRISGNADDAKEITQSVFVKTYESLNKYKPGYKFFSWLYRIAINSALMHNKQAKQHVSLNENNKYLTDNQNQEETNDDKYKKLNEALIALPEKYKSVIVLKYYAGLSYTQIATIADIDEKKVKSRLYDGRALLKEMLAKTSCL